MYNPRVNARRLLRHARREAGLTQRELASKAGVPQSTVARIETGYLQPRWETMGRLLAATEHSLEVIRSGEGIDRSQIRTLLSMTPAERLESATRDAKGLSRFLEAVRPRRRPT